MWKRQVWIRPDKQTNKQTIAHPFFSTFFSTSHFYLFMHWRWRERGSDEKIDCGTKCRFVCLSIFFNFNFQNSIAAGCDGIGTRELWRKDWWMETYTSLMSLCPVKIKVTVLWRRRRRRRRGTRRATSLERTMKKRNKGWGCWGKAEGRGGEERRREGAGGGWTRSCKQWHPSQKRKRESSGSRSSQKPALLSPRGEQGFSGCSDKKSRSSQKPALLFPRGEQGFSGCSDKKSRSSIKN